MKSDTAHLYKPYLTEYLRRKGVEQSQDDKRWRCVAPDHADNDPSAKLFKEDLLYCHTCHWKGDIFDVAGALEGHTEFKDQFEAVKRTIGELGSNTSSRPKQSASKKSDKSKNTKREKHPHVPVSVENADSIFNGNELLERGIKYKWGTRIAAAWPYKNADGAVEIMDIRFEDDKGKKSVITFYYDGKVLRSSGAPVLLFNRDKLAEHPITPVLIVEGAKTATAAEAIPGFIITTWNRGGKSAKQVDWSPLQDRAVYIWPDDDQKVYGERHNLPGVIKPSHEQPGYEAALIIQKQLPHARIIVPLPEARDIKPDGADIVEALQVKSPDALAEYILTAPEYISPSDLPPSEKNTRDVVFPFQILGIADNSTAWFLDRHGRMKGINQSSLTKTNLITLAPLGFWSEFYATGKGFEMCASDWERATDAVIEEVGKQDFDPDSVRGRGAWREPDGRICYHDGQRTIGQWDEKHMFARKKAKPLTLDAPDPANDNLLAVINICQQMVFETPADMIRCLAWSTIAPFGGALPWRPAGLLTGNSESGKSSIVDMIIKPIASPLVLSGGESTEAGIRQRVHNDAAAIVIEESEGDTPKKKGRRDDAFSLMRQSTSEDAPRAVKGTINGQGMSFVLRSMFLFVGIDPTVESIADDNRIFRINITPNDNPWTPLKISLQKTMTPDFCAGIRARTWRNLPIILELIEPVSEFIQDITKKSKRYSMAEAILITTYLVIWADQKDINDSKLFEFIIDFYKAQPAEKQLSEAEELFNRILDHQVQHSKGQRHTLREILLKSEHYKNTTESREYFDMAGRYSLRLLDNGEIAMGKRHHEIVNILQRGKNYQRLLFRHPLLETKSRNVYINNATRDCVIFKKIALQTKRKTKTPGGNE
ncbi:hypothetical protein KAR91_53995 [Candidatus Pacearchaeota archaeon]|nr:hypothetical protein [Candidatus Pacearchaeota archaeon]